MGTLQASHSVEIDAPLDRVYEIAADIENCGEWTPSVQSVEVLETHPDGSVKRVEMLVDAKVRQSKAILAYEYSPPDSLSWEQEKGDVKSLEGIWKLESLGEGRTRATYSLEADPGRMLGMLLRGPAEGKVKEFLTKGACEGLKARAEA